MPPPADRRTKKHFDDEEEEVEDELIGGEDDDEGMIDNEAEDVEDEDEDGENEQDEEDEDEDENEDENEDEDEDEDEEDEDDDDNDDNDEENAEESDSDVEEISTATSKRQERQRVAEAQQSRSKAHASRREMQQRKQSTKPKKRTIKRTEEPDEDDEEPVDQAPASGRLDPALFAAAFARQDSSARETLKPQRQRRRRTSKTPSGDKVVRAGGNTIIRTFEDDTPEPSDDAPLVHNALDRTSSLPSAKAERLKKRKLGLGKGDIRATVLDAPRRKPKKTRPEPTDDALGLDDAPFFFGKDPLAPKANKSRTRPSSRGKVRRDVGPRGAGGRIRAPTGARTFGPAVNFASR